MGVRVTDGGLSWAATIDDTEMDRVASRMENRFSSLGKRAKEEGASLESWAKSASRAAVAYFSLQGVEGFVEKLVSVRGQFQQLEVAFTTILKSKAEANKLMAQMVNLAATTPFTLTEVAQSGKQLLAYGFAADQITDTLTQLGDVAAGVSAPIGDIAYLFGTLRTQGRAFTKDIREFSGRGIPIIAELAKVLNTTEANVSNLVEAGKVGFPEVQKAFSNMTSSGGIFFNLMKEQSKTLTGQLSNLSDAWDSMLNSLGRSQEGLFSSGIQAAAELVKNYENVLSIITILMTTYGVYRAALITTAAFERAAAATNLGLALSINSESIARINNAAALAEELRAEVSNLAAKKASAAQTALSDLALLRSAQQRLAAAEASQLASSGDMLAATRVAKAKAVQAAAEDVIAAQDKLSISRKGALAASSEFYTAKQELETTAKVASSAATVELTASETIQTANKRILTAVTSAYNAVLAATPAAAFAVTLTALGVAMYALSQTTSAAVVAQKALNEIQVEVAGKYAEQSLTIKDYVKVIKDAKSTENERTTALKKLRDLNPAILGALTAQNLLTREGSGAIKEYLKWLDAKLQGEAAYVLKSDAVKRMAERNLKAGLPGNGMDKGLDWTTRLGYSLKNFFVKGRSFTSTSDESTDIVKQLNQQDQAVIDAVDKKYGAALRQRALDGITPTTATIPTVKNKAFYEAIVTKNTDDLNALDSAASDFAAKAAPIKKRIEEAKKKLLLFDISGKQTKVEDDAVKRQADMLNKIYELNQKYNTKSLTDDEAKLAEIRNAFKDLQTEIDTYNKDPKNKKVNPNLKPAMEKAIANQEYENDTAKLKVEIDKQKNIYAEYENYKTQMGLTAANKRYSNEIDTNKTFLQTLEAQRADLLNTDPMDMTGPQTERLLALNAIIAEQVTAQKQAYDTLLAENRSYEEQKKARTDQYNAAFLEMQGDANSENRAVLTQGYIDDLNALKETALAKTDIYKKLSEETLQLSREQIAEQIKALNSMLVGGGIPPEVVTKIQKQIDALKFNLQIGIEQGNLDRLKQEYADVIKELNAVDDDGVSIITPDQQKAIMQRLNEILLKMQEIDSDGDGKTTFADKLSDQFKYLKGSSAEVAQGLSSDLGQISSGFNELSGALGGNNTQAGYLLDTIGQITKAASDAAGAFASFASGDIIGGVTKTISAVTSILSIGKKVKEMNAAARKEMEDFYAGIIKGETDYQALLRKRELDTAARGKSSYKAIIAQLEAIKKQSPEIQAAYDKIFATLQQSSVKIGEGYEHGTWFRKAKTWDVMASLLGSDFQKLEELNAKGQLTGDSKTNFDNLKELHDELEAAGVSAEELRNSLGELLTGTSTSGLASGLKALFENGKRSAQDFGDSFEEIMRNSLLSSFQAKYLDDALQPFFEELAAMMESGTPTDAEIEALKQKYIEIGKGADDYLKNIEKITGRDLSDKDTATGSTMSGRIEAITSQEADKLAGLFNGFRLTQMETNGYLKLMSSSFTDQLNVAKSILEITLKIEANTLRTADNTDKLTDVLAALIEMNKKLGDPANYKQGTGRI